MPAPKTSRSAESASTRASIRRVTTVARVQASSGQQGRSLQRIRRFKTRILQRKLLTFYARYGSIEIAAEETGVSWRNVHKWKRNLPWFKRRCEIALEQYVDRVEGTIVKKCVDDLDLGPGEHGCRRILPRH
jgi:hypothetical protein